MLERGVPYRFNGGHYLEDKGHATHTDDTKTILFRAYLLEQRFDPYTTTVLEATTGKVYRIPPEAMFRSLITQDGKIIKEAGDRFTRAEKRVPLLPQEWETA